LSLVSGASAAAAGRRIARRDSSRSFMIDSLRV
jgi:hypothetical protein